MRNIEFQWVEKNWGYVNGKRQTLPSIHKQAIFYFVNEIEEIQVGNGDTLIAVFNSISSKDQLLQDYYNKFGFPDYFGFNWDALTDCLRDLDWVKQKNIIIYHNNLPMLPQKDLEIYLSILRGIVGHWNRYEEHDFNVYFNIRNYDEVKQIISEENNIIKTGI